MYNISEASLSPNEIIKIQKHAEWIKTFSDDINEIDKSNGSYIDLSKVKFKTNNEYILYFSNLRRSVDGPLYVYIDVSEYPLNLIRIISDTESKVNPIAALYTLLRTAHNRFKTELAGITFIFYQKDEPGYFTLTSNKVTGDYHNKFLKVLGSMEYYKTKSTKHAATGKVVDVDPIKPVENTAIDEEEQKKKELGNKIVKAVETSETEEEAIAKLEEDDAAERLISALSYIENPDRGPKLSDAQRRRIRNSRDRFTTLTFKDKTIGDLIKDDVEIKELPSSDFKVDSINDEWKDMKFINFNKEYDLDADILKVIHSFSSKTFPITVSNIKVTDTSTKMDYIDTYKIKTVNHAGTEATWTIDVPQLINNRFLMLRGNEKVISGQLVLLPCTKTEPDTVQLVSNYNKVFVRAIGATGKYTSYNDRIVKTMNRVITNKVKGVKVVKGDFKTICAKYSNLPADYVDLANLYSYIEVKYNDGSKRTYSFDQDKLRQMFPCPANKIPVGFTQDNTPIFYDLVDSKRVASFSQLLGEELSLHPEIKDIYNSINIADKLVYSEASILGAKIPIIAILGYLNGLGNTLRMANVKHEIHTSKSKIPHNFDFVKVGTEYLAFEHNYENSLLLYGLARIPDIEQYRLADLDNRSTWINVFGDIKDRLLSDGIENFNDLFVDPITLEVCKETGNADTFSGLLLEANDLLADNSFTKHTNIYANRYRTTEIIAGYLYNVMASAYAGYANGMRKGRGDVMSFKRTALIDALMQDPTQSDLSTLSVLMELESSNATTFKGLSGLNSERAYSLDKRTFDNSMVNKVGLSTGFAANVGITRQSTLDMNIKGKRGFIKQDEVEDISPTKTFSATEAITPFGVTRDDPFRSAMTFVQTAKHSMRTNAAAPLLITNGTDEAMPYLASDKFAFKAKSKGKVTELVSGKYMVITYDNGESEYIDLNQQIHKNSDGGFYVLLKLVTKYKQGQSFKKGDILAYEHLSFSDNVGGTDKLSYNVGALVKVAIPNSDTGFEDSTACSTWMSEALASEVVVKKEITLAPNTNIYHLVGPGQAIQEGEPLILFQNSFSEKDANLLLKSITDEEMVSDLGRIRLKSKYTGSIQDVEIFRTRPDNTYSESIQKLLKDYDKNHKNKRDIYTKYNIKGINKLEPNHPLPETGELKNVGDGIKINIYIKYKDKFSVGDKNVAQSAAKGTNKEIYPKGKEPRSEYRPNEPIHAVYAVGSFNARMITSVINSGYINKGCIELDRQVKEIMGIKWKSLEDIQMKANSDDDLSI